MSQAEQILEYMMMVPGRRISTWLAYEKFHCTTLAQRIADLRKEITKEKPLLLNGINYFIDDELVTRDGKTFSEYWLAPVPVKEPKFEFKDEPEPEEPEEELNYDFYVDSDPEEPWWEEQKEFDT